MGELGDQLVGQLTGLGGDQDAVVGSRRSIASTVRGWELVWPCPMRIGPSYDERRRARRGRNPARGTASKAAVTASITPPNHWPAHVC